MVDKKILQPGDLLSLRVIGSPLYKDTYRTEIQSLSEQTMTVTMPMAMGKIVLLSAGTPVEILGPRGDVVFTSEVKSRGFNPNPHLVIQLPFHLNYTNRSRPRVITITSGKGGVGKTTFSINLAITLSQMGQRVFLMDADLGTANVDVLMNLQPRYNLTHIISKEKEILDIIVEGPGGVFVVPGGSGLQNLADMEEWQFNRLISALQTLEQYADYIIIDTGAGLGKNVVNFALAADNIIIITSPEPHSITDAYAIMKVLDEQPQKPSPYLVLNRVESPREWQDVSAKMTQVVNRFLTLRMTPLGYILDDPVVPKSNRRLQPFVLHCPNSDATRCIKAIADKLVNPVQEDAKIPATQTFFTKLRDLFSK